jgi:hypothetical protein
VRQFEFPVVRFLYGPRLVGGCCAFYCSISPTISSMLHSVCVTPAAITGDMRKVVWMHKIVPDGVERTGMPVMGATRGCALFLLGTAQEDSRKYLTP